MFAGFEPTPDRAVRSLLASGALHVYPLTAVRADFRKQNFSTFGIQWYVDATFHCRRCGKEFAFSVAEQRFWYEQCRFYVDAIPRQCPRCRHALRELKSLKQEYDRDVASASRRDVSVERKERLLWVIEQLAAGGSTVTPKMGAARATLLAQAERLRRPGAA